MLQLCVHLAVEKAVGETKGFRCKYLNHYIGSDLDYWCVSCSHYQCEDEQESLEGANPRPQLTLVPTRREEVLGESLASLRRAYL